MVRRTNSSHRAVAQTIEVASGLIQHIGMNRISTLDIEVMPETVDLAFDAGIHCDNNLAQFLAFDEVLYLGLLSSE